MKVWGMATGDIVAQRLVGLVAEGRSHPVNSPGFTGSTTQRQTVDTVEASEDRRRVAHQRYYPKKGFQK